MAGTKVDNSIGHGISRVLAFFGNQDAKDALKSENKYDTMVASHKTTVPTIKNPVSPIAKAVAALNPIGSVHADDMPLPGNHVAAATSASALAAPIAAELSTAKNKKVAPLDRIVAYMSSLFDLASDNQKGLYVRVADNALDNPPAAAPAPRAATITSAGPSTIGSAASSVGMGGSSTSSPSYVAPAQRSTTMAQSGAATNSGWHPGHATGKLHFDVAAGQPGSETSGSIGAGPKSYGKVDGFNIDQMWDRMSGTIASGESGKAGYDAHHGGTIPGLTNMTIGQVKKMKGAMGKYQLLPGTTLGMAARNVGLSDSDLFNPANQEAMGKYLFAHRVKIGAKGGAAGIQKQLALEWASLPKNATGAGAYDGDAAGNMAAGGSARGQALASIISGSSSPGTVSGAPASTADSIDSATQDVAKNSSDNSPSVIVAPSSGGSSTPRQSSAGTGSGLAGPMVTRNSDSSVQAITQNFIAGSSAMG